jgi:hypothetical protein
MKIKFTPTFERYFKKYLKKDKNLLSEFKKFLDEIKKNPIKGKSLGKNLYKVRLKSQNKGKSGGYRIIHYLKREDEIVMVIIYAKNEYSNVTIQKLQEILKELE